MLMRLEKRPPRAMFITSSALKSGVDRAAPTSSTRSDVCGAPGLSTMITRALVVFGKPRSFFTHLDNIGEPAGALPVHVLRRERRMQRDIREEVEGLREILLERSGLHPR